MNFLDLNNVQKSTLNENNNEAVTGFTNGNFQHYDYFVKHKRNLMMAFNRFLFIYNNSEDLRNLVNLDLYSLKERILKHDLDKFDLGMFEVYTEFYYEDQIKKSSDELLDNGIENEHYISEEKREEFDKKVEQHYAINRHHIEFFEINNCVAEDIDICEMACDFLAVSLGNEEPNSQSALEYYRNSEKAEKLLKYKDRMDLEKFEKVLELIDV